MRYPRDELMSKTSSPPPPRPQLRIFSPMLNTFLLLISPPMYPLFSPSTPTWLDSTSLLHLQFPYFSHSITPVPPISISLFLSAFHPILCLPPTCLSLSLKVCHWKFRHEKKKKKTVLASNSPVSRQFLFLPFYQPRLSHPQHHCWSWIFRSFQANVFNLPLLLPSLSLLTLFHLTWLFTHWCSDAKVMNSQQNAVCFNWRTMEILQEETFFMVCVQHVFISVWLNMVHQSRKT